MSTSEQTRPADHPLDPLTAGEFRQAAAILRRDRGVGPRWRFASIELREPDKDTLRVLEPGTAAGPRGAGRLLGPGHRPRLPRGAVADQRQRGQLDAAARPAAEHDRGRMARVRRDAARGPALAAALARRGITDLSRVLTDLWAYPAATIPPQYHGLRLGWADVLVPGQRAGQPVRPSPQRAAPDRGPEPDGRCWRSRTSSTRGRRPGCPTSWANTCPH